MPVIRVKGGFKIRGSYKGRSKLIGTKGGRPFRTKAAAQRISNLRSSYKHR